MRLSIGLVVLSILGAGHAGAQYEMADPQHLTVALEDVDYAELLGTAKLTKEQLGELHRMQLMLQIETQLDEVAAAAFAEIRAKVLSGMSESEAVKALGEKGQACQQIQRRYRQMLDTHVGELLGKLTPEQRSALLWEESPARGLGLIVDAVAQLRGVPDAQWTQFRAQTSEAFAKVAQTDPGSTATVETVGALLDTARALSDEDFAAKRGELGQEWAEVLMPNLMQQFGSEQHQTQQLTQTCRRLLSYPRGHMLVQAKLNALGEE